ncbi:MAG: BatA domain-containing protein [Victivallales bacterium]|nr:BatA domain-containing protein [Victivallales bacterium]
MTFLQPLLLWGLPLLLIPVAIHLMNRLRYRSVKWAAMIFLLKANRNSTSMAKIRQWLVLLLRTLAVCAIVLALSRPLVGGWLGWSLSGSPDSVVVLLDRSASMGTKSGNGANLLQTALSKLTETGAKSAPNAKTTLVDSANPAEITTIPAWNVLPELDATRSTQTTADLPAMLTSALERIIRDTPGQPEIWIASDLQRSNWRISSRVWKDLDAKLKSLKNPPKIRLLALAGKSTDNRAVTFVAASRHPTEDGREIREITYEIHSPADAMDSDIPLIVGDASGTRQIVAHATPGTCRLSQKISSPKGNGDLSWGFITLPPDANTLDDTVFYAFGTPPKEKAIVASDDSATAAILALAAAPGDSETSSAEIVGSTAATSAELNYSSVIIVDLQPDAKFAAKLKAAAEKGAMVLFLPPRSQNAKLAEWEKLETRSKGKELKISDWNHDDGILSDTPSGDLIPLDNLKILKRSVPVVCDEKTAILAYYNDGKPFLTRKKIGKGAFYHCSTLPIDSWSNLGDGLVLVPMERRLMKLGAARFAKVKYSECGTMINKRPGPTPRVLASAKIADDSPDSTTKKHSDHKTETGVYSWDDEVAVVNLPAAEIPIAPLSDAEVAALTPKNKIRLFRANGTANETMQAEIWRVFLIAMLLALIAESLITLPRRSVVSRQ